MAAKKRSEHRRKSPAKPVEHSGMQIVHRHAAGVDVGNETHYVAVHSGDDPEGEPVRSFACFTADLERLAGWLQRCGVRTVAMQSTGVYWIPLFDILEQKGFEVFLVNARDTRNLPGRKSDVQECQWLLKLHTHGLLKNSFHPAAEVRCLRTLWRQRGDHVRSAGRCVQRMQKALTQMNLQLANVISDLAGVTGLAIVRAIAAGERDPMRLAALRHRRIRASQQQIAASLQGNWRPELVFVLRQELAQYDAYQQRIEECDQELARRLHELADAPQPEHKRPAPPPSHKRQRAQGNAPSCFDLRAELIRVCGVDLTRIDGIDVLNAQTILSEIGWDMTRWKTEGHFASWLGLCPNNRISGEKVLGRATRRVISRAANAFRMAASALFRSQSYLGAQFRRLRTRLGAPKATTAMAHRLARLVYRLLKYGHDYVDRGTQYYEERYRQQQIRLLHKKAAQLGFDVQPA
jgi:transposase